MKIRFFSAYELAMATFYSDLLPHLAEAGHQVEVVISQAEYRAGRRLEDVAGQGDQIRVYRTANFGLQPDSALKSAVIMTIYVVHMALYTLLGARADRNVFLSTPPLLPLWGTMLSRLRGQPYTCVVMDVYPDLFVAYGRLRRDALVTRLLERFSSLALRHADSVIVIGRCMAECIQAKGVAAERLHVIPNWMNEETVVPVPHDENPFRHEHGLNGTFVVLYSGNMGQYHHFDDILAAAAMLRDRDDIAFVFIGDGVRRSTIESWVREQKLANVLLLPYQDMKRLSYSLSAGDLHLVTLMPSCTGFAVPSKSYGILAAGRPILYQGDPDGEIARLIREEGIGAVLRLGDAEGVRACILGYAAQRSLVLEQGQRARRLIEGPYSRAAALAQYEAVLTGAGPFGGLGAGSESAEAGDPIAAASEATFT